MCFSIIFLLFCVFLSASVDGKLWRRRFNSVEEAHGDKRKFTIGEDGISHKDLEKLVNRLTEEVAVLKYEVDSQYDILEKQDVELDSVSEVSNESLSILKEITGKGPGDCSELLAAGVEVSGVYTLYPKYSPPVRAYCEMNHDGGGWTVFQRRYDGNLSFSKPWVAYARGFGDPSKEHWLGLRTLSTLTKAHNMELYVGMTDYVDGYKWEKYGSFEVGSEDERFKLRVATPSGNAGDSLSFHNGASFSARDRDNDDRKDSCSKLLGNTGWWFKSCHISNLNGVYYQNLTSEYDAMTWYGIRNDFTSLKASIMLMRPVDFKGSKDRKHIYVSA